MTQWHIYREDIPPPRKVASDITLAADPVSGDVLVLKLPQSDLEGHFVVVQRVIQIDQATLVVKAYKS